MGALSKRRKHIPGQLALTDFRVVPKEYGIKETEVREYPIRVFVLEKKNSKSMKQSVDYRLLYDRREIVFLNKFELFKNEGSSDFRILDKVDYLFVLLTEEFFNDFSMIKILLDNSDFSKNSKLRLIINDKELRRPQKRIKICQNLKQQMKELEESGIINCDIEQTYELIQKLSSKIGEIFRVALENDMWEDMELQDKLAYFLQKDGRMISSKYSNEEESVKDRKNTSNEEVRKNTFLENHIHKHVNTEINYYGEVREQQFNHANDNGVINAEQKNG